VLLETEMDELGLSYEDVVGAADVVVTKPGYGIVSDAVGAGTRLLYTDRGDFPEYPILVRELPRYLAAEYITGMELAEGQLGRALQAVLGKPIPEAPDTSGADIAAFRLLEHMARG